jgi:hypothetical protein
MIKVTQIVLSAAPVRLSALLTEAQNIPYRQLLLVATGATATLGDAATVTTATGFPVLTTGTLPVSIGPFPTGPVKLSDFYAVGAGSTLTVLGVPF